MYYTYSSWFHSFPLSSWLYNLRLSSVFIVSYVSRDFVHDRNVLLVFVRPTTTLVDSGVLGLHSSRRGFVSFDSDWTEGGFRRKERVRRRIEG